jgi:hypothetical protein
VGHWYPGPALAGLVALALAGVVIVLIGRWRAIRRMMGWSADAGWSAVGRTARDWPWQGLLLEGEVQVDRAWTGERDGLAITAGQTRWSGRALAGAVPAGRGKGVFVVVQLPLPVPGMAMRFPYRFIGDSHRLESPALGDAFRNGEIPPWTVTGDQLFTVEEHLGWTTPEAMELAIGRALRVVRLLDLGPDVSTSPTSDVSS